MIQFRKILVPVDFSAFSEDALEYACALAWRFRSEIHLLHVVPESFLDALRECAGQDVLDRQEQQALRQLDQLPRGHWRDKLGVTRELETGIPVEEILDYVRNQSIDLIVMGTHGRAGLQSVLLGSVAENIVRLAPCPVITVRNPRHLFVQQPNRETASNVEEQS